MVERKVLIDRRPLVYEGIFRMDELWAIISRFIKSRGYTIIETRNEEKLTDTGKDVFIEIAPYRKLSDYFKKLIEVEIYVRKLNDKTVKVDGKHQKYQHGEVEIYFSAVIQTDWRSRWEGTGFYFLLRTIMDKFVRYDILHHAENEAVKDTLDMIEDVKAYFNMTRFKIVEADAHEGRLRAGVE